MTPRHFFYKEFMTFLETNPTQKNFDEIVELNFSNSGLIQLPEAIIQCKNLKKLNCSYNQLTNIDVLNLIRPSRPDDQNYDHFWNINEEDVEDKYKNWCLSEEWVETIEYLDCSHNKITHLPYWDTYAFASHLDCSYNELKKVGFAGSYFDCSNNQITEIYISNDECLEQFTENMYINCSYNQLTNISLPPCCNTVELNCSYNHLTELDNCIFDNGSMELISLNCSNNKITHFPKSSVLSNDVCLINLDCSNNQLTDLDDIFYLDCLEKLDFSNNKLTHLPLQNTTMMTDSDYKKLIYLDCSNNQLTCLPETLKNSKDLEYLDCSNNLLLEEYPESFKSSKIWELLYPKPIMK